MKTGKHTMTPGRQLMACVIRQYGTGLYRAWVSLEKSNVICLSTHQDEAAAAETINRFLATYQAGQIKTHEDILSFINAAGVPDPAHGAVDLAA